MSAKYDLIVIGAGPAGEKGAAQAAYFGKRVALVEKSPVVGGAVASTSIPFKALRERGREEVRAAGASSEDAPPGPGKVVDARAEPGHDGRRKRAPASPWERPWRKKE